MSQFSDQVHTADQAPSPSPAERPSAAERRRPGRPDAVSRELIPLLRRDSLLPDGFAHRDPDDLAGARGIGLAAVVGLAVWTAGALLAWWIFDL